MSIAERNSQLNALSLRIAAEDKAGFKGAASADRSLQEKLGVTQVDEASVIFARGGQPAPPEQSADHLELAPEKLVGLLAKRATSNLRLPAAPPTTTQ
jgi:hypothetical protein